VKKVIVTVGPKSISNSTLTGLVQAGAATFRINLSHSTSQSLEQYFSSIQSVGVMPSIDTQGAQLRVEELPGKSEFFKGELINLVFGANEYVNSSVALAEDSTCIVLNHPEVSDQVSEDDILKIDFSGLIVCLRERKSSFVWQAEVVGAGRVIKNRAVDVSGRAVKLSPLTKFDLEAIQFAQSKGCREVYASFVSSRSDVLEIRKHLLNDTFLVSKIESALGVANAAEIIDSSDAILIDRGDLSREISIPAVPIAVNSIIQMSNKAGKPVYVATNVLDSMMSSPLPSRAEISDIYTLLNSGVSGLVLAAEVAIGDNPIASAALIEYLVRLYECHALGLFGVGQVNKPSRELIGDQLYNWL